MEKNTRGGDEKMGDNGTKKKRATLLLVGNSGVGKTALVNRYVHDKFEEERLEERGDGELRATPKTVDIEGKTVELSFVDGSGIEDVQDPMIGSVQGYPFAIVLVFDVTDMRSFLSLDKWWRRIEQRHGKPIPGECVMLVGNKRDLEWRRITEVQARAWMVHNDIRIYVETSALRDSKICTGISDLVSNVLSRQEADLRGIGYIHSGRYKNLTPSGVIPDSIENGYARYFGGSHVLPCNYPTDDDDDDGFGNGGNISIGNTNRNGSDGDGGGGGGGHGNGNINGGNANVDGGDGGGHGNEGNGNINGGGANVNGGDGGGHGNDGNGNINGGNANLNVGGGNGDDGDGVNGGDRADGNGNNINGAGNGHGGNEGGVNNGVRVDGNINGDAAPGNGTYCGGGGINNNGQEDDDSSSDEGTRRRSMRCCWW